MAFSDKVVSGDAAEISLACAICGEFVSTGNPHQCKEKQVISSSEVGRLEDIFGGLDGEAQGNKTRN